MPLKPQLKSLYLGIFNETMISRSLRKDISKEKLREYKIALFHKLDRLTDKMDSGNLTESDITETIASLADKFGISWGQSQKAINVILKYHHVLYHSGKARLKNILHCPLDSVILGEISERKSLRKINDSDYRSLQKTIANRAEDLGLESKVDFDKYWDERNLRDEGLL